MRIRILILTLIAFLFTPATTGFAKKDFRGGNEKKSKTYKDKRGKINYVDPYIGLRFSVFADINGGSDACRTGEQIADVQRSLDRGYRIFRHFIQDSRNDFYYKETGAGLQGEELDRFENKLISELLTLVRGNKTTLCAQLDKAYFYKGKKDLSEFNIKRIKGTVVLLDFGLALHLKGRNINVEVLTACCNQKRKCTELISWEEEDCSGDSVALGPATRCGLCSTSPLPKKSDTPPKGQCCFHGKCNESKKAECEPNGVYIKRGQQCSVELCQSLTGACWDGMDCFKWRTKAFCDKIEGDYRHGEDCPEEQRGSCMLEGQCETNRTEKFCKLMGGEFLGNAPCGVCCATSGKCHPNQSAKSCRGKGQFKANIDSCSPNPCDQPDPKVACCDPTGQCKIEERNKCLKPRNFLEGINECRPDTCPQPVACCQETGCSLELDTKCNGTVLKDINTCEPDPCVGTCYMQCPFTDEQHCMSHSFSDCNAFGGTHNANQPECLYTGDAINLVPPFCTEHDCDGFIGVWLWKPADLSRQESSKAKLYLSLNSRHKAVLFNPSTNELNYGEYKCEPHQMEGEGNVRVDLYWPDGTSDHFQVQYPDNTPSLICKMGEKKCGKRVTREKMKDHLHRELIKLLNEQDRRIYKPDYEWETNPAPKKPKTIQIVYKVVEIYGSGYTPIYYDDGSAKGMVKKEGSLVDIMTLLRSDDKDIDEAFREFIDKYIAPQSYDKKNKKCYSKNLSSLQEIGRLPHIFTELVVRDLPNKDSKNRLFTSMDQINEAIEEGAFELGGSWESTGEIIESSYEACDE